MDGGISSERVRNWLAEPPAYDAFFKGGACEVRVEPRPQRWGFYALGDLHGMVSSILGDSGVPHHPRFPMFTVSMDGIGRPTLILADDECAALVANGRFPIEVNRRPGKVIVGPLRRLRTPTVFGRGQRIIRIHSESPVVVRRTVRKREPGHQGAYHTTPTSENMASTIGTQFCERLGLGLDTNNAEVELIDKQTRGVKVYTSTKVKLTWGWEGTVTLRVNAPAEWLFRAAEVIGLGGRTAYGFGRIRVEGMR